MKVFYIQSYITFLSSISIINQNNFKTDEVLLLTGRNFKIPDSYNHLKKIDCKWFDKWLYIPSYGNFFFYFKNYLLIKLLDFIILFNVKFTKFELYLPHSKNFLFKLFISHKKCERFSFIEEGLLSYNFLSHKTSIKSNNFALVNHGNRIFNDEHKFTNKLFLFFPKAAQVSQSIEIVNMEMGLIMDTKLIEFDKNAIIIVLDPIVELGFINKNQFESILNKFLSTKTDCKVYYKLHPKQIDEIYYDTFFNRNFSHSIKIENNVCLEEQFKFSKQKLNIYGFYSSLLFYGSNFGHNSYSLANILEKEYANNKLNFLYTFPLCFHNNVIKL
jgi:hypothetical protein